ncbi:MAG: DNA repair protein RadC [Muribaculaceae bacterium]|nr:DNA repair protein RadC [Muribaculaceae bacterium]
MSDHQSTTVKDLAPEDQPRYRAERYGVKVLTTTDLWALILRTGVPGTPITTLCRDIMQTAGGSMRALEQTSRQTLLQTKGLGITKVLQIEAVLELIRRYNIERLPERPIIRSSGDTFRIMVDYIGNIDHEEIWFLLLNRRNEVIKKERSTVGSAVASIFDIKSIVRNAILNRAEGIILCHNHPSGNLIPSVQDDQITKKLAEAVRLFDIRLLDHVIITREAHYSYFDNGRLR